MLASGNQNWIVESHGDREVVTTLAVAFISFLKSLRFAASGGATDGNK
jgi:hypothetical protein